MENYCSDVTLLERDVAGSGMLTIPCKVAQMLDAVQWKGWGGVGHVNISCKLHMLDVTQWKGWGGVGHVNVLCRLHTCWMPRN